MASWLAQFTKGSNSNALSPPSSSSSSSSSTTSRTSSSTSQRKKSKLSDAMDTTSSNAASSLDEGGFYWVPVNSEGGDTSSTVVGVDMTPGHVLYPRLNATTTTTTTTSSAHPSARGTIASMMDEEEPLPPYRRPVSGVATLNFSSAAATAAAAAVSNRAPTLGRTPAYAPLQLSSFQINPRLSAIATPPPHARSTAELVDKMRGMETKLKQGPSYDPCFEVEIAAQAKLDRQKQDMKAKELEERYRKYRAVVEAEAKRQQDIAITEWVEQHQQQQRQQKQHDDDAALSATASSSVMPGVDQTLLDLSFPSNRRPNQLATSQPPSDDIELPPPYPGPLRATDGQKHAPPVTTTPLLHFPAPTGQPAPGMTAGGGSFAGPPAYYHPGAPFAASSAAYPPYTAIPVAGQPPAPIAFPVPPQQAVPSSAMFAHSGSSSPGGAPAASAAAAPTSFPVNSALLMPPPRTTLEEYQRKYPVLANPERRAVFIQLLEMRFKPDIVALGLEVYPDNQLEKIVTFVANFHKLVEMGFAPERVKQALLLHDDGNVQKAITYLEELDNLIKAGLKESEIFDAFLLFDNDIQKASSFLLAHKALAQFGFDDIRIREALLMCDNSQEKAAQYLLMNT